MGRTAPVAGRSVPAQSAATGGAAQLLSTVAWFGSAGSDAAVGQGTDGVDPVRVAPGTVRPACDSTRSSVDRSPSIDAGSSAGRTCASIDPPPGSALVVVGAVS